MRSDLRGFSLIEAILSIAIIGIVTAATVTYFVPQLGLFFYVPRNVQVQRAGADLIETIVEGDARARGVRYARPLGAAACGIIDHPSLGVTTPTLLSYTYLEADGVTSHTIAIRYTAATQIVERSIDSGAYEVIPYYVKAASAFQFDPSETRFFRYFNTAGTEMDDIGTPIVPNNVSRIQIGVFASSGAGAVEQAQGKIKLRGGTEIKRYA